MPERGSALGAVGHVGGESGFFESAAAVQEEKIRDRVVGDKQIHAAVIVYVRGDDSPGFAEMFGNAGLPAHIRESAVAIVMKQPAWPWLENARDAVVMRAVSIDAAAERFC